MNIYRATLTAAGTRFFEDIKEKDINRNNVKFIKYSSLDGEAYIDSNNKVHIEGILYSEVICKDVKDNHEFTLILDEDIDCILIENESEEYDDEIDGFIFEGNQIDLKEVTKVLTLSKISPYLVEIDGEIKEYFA